MPTVDLPIEQLHHYMPEVTEPADFDSWWSAQLATLPEAPIIVSDAAVPAPFDGVRYRDVTFHGADGAEVTGLLTLPESASSNTPIPGVVQFVGYGGGRGLPGQNPWYTMAGYAHFIIDVRGQGGNWQWGSTPDPGSRGAHASGWLTDGLQSPEDYYYRRVILDAVAAIRVMRSIEGVDPSKIAVVGGSQGGGLTLAATALDGNIQAACCDFPFITDIPRALKLAFGGPYPELVRYFSVYPGIVDTAMNTLRYVDGVNFAKRITCPILFSTGLLDDTCPTSTTFGAYHVCGSRQEDKELAVYPYGNHAGGGHWHTLRQCEFLKKHLG